MISHLPHRSQVQSFRTTTNSPSPNNKEMYLEVCGKARVAKADIRAAAARRPPASAVLIFGVDLLDRPENRFFELLDLGVGRVLPDFLKLLVEIK